MKIAGIDYGSKLAGTTAIALWEVGTKKLILQLSEKKKDADVFLKKVLLDFQPSLVFIDAPLSLPLVYLGIEGYSDYFYRKADRELQAMSPMFLGGLTARAMKLKAGLSEEGFHLFETYPAQQAKRMNLLELGYKKESFQHVWKKLKEDFPEIPLQNCPKTWHEVDAILALIGAYRYLKNEHKTFGEEKEGLIWV